MTSSSKPIVRIKRIFEATPEQVFDAWLNPEEVKKWLFATPTGEIVKAKIDARVGGLFTIVRREEEEIEHTGEYLEIARPHRLAFTFSVPKFSKEATRVIIEVVPEAKGCELTLTHENVLPEWASRTEEGWTMILNNLATTLDTTSS